MKAALRSLPDDGGDDDDFDFDEANEREMGEEEYGDDGVDADARYLDRMEGAEDE